MHFAISCIDKPDHVSLRMENRPDHLDYLKANQNKILVGGPTLSDDGAQPTGSLLIMEFDSLSEAEAFAAADPYNKAGLFGSVTVKTWKKVFG